MSNRIEILIWNPKKEVAEWVPGTMLQKVGATDAPYRVECRSDDGREYIGFAAAHPDCVQPLGLAQLKLDLEKVEKELDKCRGTVQEDGWQTQRYAKKMRRWDFYAQRKMELLAKIEYLEMQVN